jgi:UDP-GlcNAc:undecaprenyl-phosphate/decaprenyl-phosphate GlcNAc-1-phosphate transferase
VREYLLIMFVAAAVTYLMTPVARRFAVRWGAMAEVRDRDVHAIPTPRLGGLAMFCGFAAALLVASRLPFLGQVFDNSDDGVALLSGAALVCLLGVADDKWGLDAITKLAGQVLAAGVMVLQGVQMLYLPIGSTLLGFEDDGLPGAFVLGPAEGGVLTILVVVVTINAVNFVDGLDGLAGGMVAIGAVAFFAFSYRIADVNGYSLAVTAALLCACLGGACVGFLPHNFFPARIFMGDSGSMLLGLVLSGSALSLTGQFASVSINRTADFNAGNGLALLLPLLLPVSILVVPFLDLVLAVVRRTRRGQMFYHPDKEHLHHRLLEFGHSQRVAVVIMWLWAGLVAFGAVFVTLSASVLSVVVTLAWAVLTLALTFALPRLRRPGVAPFPAAGS